MEGWKLDETKLAVEYKAKHPNYNQNRTCHMCGKHFASGKPRTMCLSCMRAAGLVMEATTTKPKSWFVKMLENNIVGITGIGGIACIMSAGFMTDSIGCASFASILVAVWMLMSGKKDSQ